MSDFQHGRAETVVGASGLRGVRKFDGSSGSFAVWKADMCAALVTKGDVAGCDYTLLDIAEANEYGVEPDVIDPDKDKKAKRTWTKANQMLYSLIILCIDDGNKRLLEESAPMNGVKAWKLLCEKYQSTDILTLNNLRSELYSAKCVDDDDVENFIVRSDQGSRSVSV